MLIAAAAQNGMLIRNLPYGKRSGNASASNRRLSYGQLAESAAKISPPQQVTLKDPKDFKLIGKPLKRLDTPEKTKRKRHLRD